LTSTDEKYVIERVFKNDSVRLRRGTLLETDAPLEGDTIAAEHKKGDRTTLSARLLELFGFGARQILFSEKTGVKNEVSFRNVSHLAMVDEIRIQESRSPALGVQWTQATSEKRLWNLMLTGLDDADLPSKPASKKEVKLSVDSKIEWISQYISKQEAVLKQILGDTDDLDARLLKVSAALQESTTAISADSSRLAALEERRKQAWTTLVEVKDRRFVVSEHLSRFNLLQTYYDTDIARLNAVIEAGASFERLSSGHCAVCGELPSSENTVEGFTRAASIELDKVRRLASDLKDTIGVLLAEEVELKERESKATDERKLVNDEIESELKPRTSIAADSLRDLVQAKSELDRAASIKAELADLAQALKVLEAEKKIKVPKAAKLEKVSTRTAAAFCDVVAATLKAWKYPIAGSVAFDPDKFDVVLGNQDRGSMGKGHRAVTHAAFIVSLMRYCRLQGLPHPGFVVLDSPLNPYRGNSMGTGLDAPVNEEVKAAFYEDLAADTTGDQFIIFENIPPPAHLRDLISYAHFTGNTESGRRGFFP
jgi:DNA repair exonuclease SbcCD ATPase subunit